ncbi:MAG: histidine kinase dimerization/phospho-acceptor domain-containing protein, partial [Bilophila sp.]
MDGFQITPGRSLQFRLSLWLACCILIIALAAGALSFAIAFEDANTLQDDQLRQVASLLSKSTLTISKNTTLRNILDSKSDSRLIIQQLEQDEDSRPMGLTLASDLPEGIQTVSVNNEPWRIVVKTLRSGQRIAVAQQTSVRDEIARDSGLSTLMPFLVLIPVLVILLRVLIQRLFKPITRMASELDRRHEQDLGDVEETCIPLEIVPFVAAINRLLARVSRSLDLQRRFMADAAHELRSPLTALTLQAEGLEATEMSPQARERLQALRNGLHRAQILLNQLLALARAQGQAQPGTPGVSVHKVFRQTLEDLMPQAEAQKLDIGVVSREDVEVAISETDLSTIIKNLVDNTIRYTPSGGRVDLDVQRDGERVQI